MGLSRRQFWMALGKVSDGPRLEPMTHRAYVTEEERIWREVDESPHGRPWHTSFHASQFPGGESDKRCARKSLYVLMNTPEVEPFKPMNRAIMDIGQALERQIVYRWGRYGRTIGGSVPLSPNGPIYQLGLEDDEHWLTGSSDAVLDLRPHWDSVLPVDIKGKDQDKIDLMKIGALSYDLNHYLQIQAYMYLCRVNHISMGWDAMGLEPARGGVIFYASRQRPRHTAEFYVSYDEKFVEAGLARLREWKQLFLDNSLPERPKEWKWTEQPCKWCPFKKEV